MQITFNNKKIAKLCNSKNEAIKKIGSNYANDLIRVLNELHSASKLDDIHFGNPHPLKGNKLGQFAITIKAGVRIVFKASEPIPKNNDEAIDWKNVTKINIIFIGDYH